MWVDIDLVILGAIPRLFVKAKAFLLHRVFGIPHLLAEIYVQTLNRLNIVQVILIFIIEQSYNFALVPNNIKSKKFSHNHNNMKQNQQAPIMISVYLSEWERLNLEVRTLRQENIYWRQKAKKEYSPIFQKHKSITVQSSDAFYQNQSPLKQKSLKQKFKKQMYDWSRKLHEKKQRMKILSSKRQKGLSKSNKQSQNLNDKVMQAQQISLFGVKKQLEQKENKNDGSVRIIKQQQDIQQNGIDKTQQIQETAKKQQNELKLIQAICLYGPKQSDIQKSQITITHLQNSLLFISNPQLKTQYQMYSSQFFSPDGVPIRRLKQTQIKNYTDQTIFRKNTKRVDCSVVLFRPDQQTQKILSNNVLVEKVNCVKRLAAFFVQFNDYVYVQYNQQNEQNPNKSMQHDRKQKQKQSQSVETARQIKLKKNKKYCIKSKYTLCIFTYFPIINVMEQLATSMMDQIKIRRVQAYALQNSSQSVSINKFIYELSKISSQILSEAYAVPMKLNSQFALSLGHFKILFNFFEPKLDDLLYGSWVFDILKILNRDLIYDIFTNIMTEQSICFVCQNLKLLTQVVFFFVSVLFNPFQYPHPCVSQCLNYDLLDSPFVVTLGLRQTSNWVEQNAKLYPKKIFIDLNDNQVKICGQKKLKHIKSQKLKKIFHNFYKKLEGSSPVPQFFKKKNQQTIIRPAARQQNQLVYILLKNVRNYFFQELINHFPVAQIINTLKQASPQLNEHSKISSMLKQIKKYIKQSRKKHEKDQFLDLLVQQQVFYIYVSKIYELR